MQTPVYGQLVKDALGDALARTAVELTGVQAAKTARIGKCVGKDTNGRPQHLGAQQSARIAAESLGAAVRGMDAADQRAMEVAPEPKPRGKGAAQCRQGTGQTGGSRLRRGHGSGPLNRGQRIAGHAERLVIVNGHHFGPLARLVRLDNAFADRAVPRQPVADDAMHIPRGLAFSRRSGMANTERTVPAVNAIDHATTEHPPNSVHIVVPPFTTAWLFQWEPGQSVSELSYAQSSQNVTSLGKDSGLSLCETDGVLSHSGPHRLARRRACDADHFVCAGGVAADGDEIAFPNPRIVSGWNAFLGPGASAGLQALDTPKHFGAESVMNPHRFNQAPTMEMTCAANHADIARADSVSHCRSPWWGQMAATGGPDMLRTAAQSVLGQSCSQYTVSPFSRVAREHEGFGCTSLHDDEARKNGLAYALAHHL